MPSLRSSLAPLIVAVLTVLAAPAIARAADEAGKAAIREVITRQIEAFRRDDGAAAYGFASPEIQALFPSAERFMDMVRRDYAAVYRPRSFRFLELRDLGDAREQRVLITGPDGAIAIAVYRLVEVGGRWRIDGCRLEQGEES
jgi:hypothetical protein